MKDLIDLGNLAFNRLMTDHGELEESRVLFLYGITTSTRWHILNTSKWVLIEQSGLSKNFDDPVLDDLQSKWKQLSTSQQIDKNQRRLDQMRAEFDRPAPKPGDIFEFGKSSGHFREISF